MNEALQQTHFCWIDGLIVVLYLSLSVAAGIWANRYVKDMSDYVVAGRKVKSYLGIATMTGTEMGLITIMYSAQKGFSFGFAAFHIAVVAAIVTFLVGLSGFIVVPLRRLGVMTIPEFYGIRYGKKARILGGFVLAFAGILNMGLFLKVGSQYVTGVTGMGPESHALIAVMVGLLVLVLLYTILGGMVSVIITDYLQFVVLSLGLIVVVVFCLFRWPWSHMVDVVEQVRGMAGFNPFQEEGFGWEYVLWMTFIGLISCSVWQTAVLRALCAESPKVVKKLYMWSSVGFLIRFLIPYFLGIAALVFIYETPELKELFLEGAEGDRVNSLMAMPVLFARILPVGLLGLVTAAMLAAFMSTHDSYLLCWSAVITQDVVSPLLGERLSTKSRIWLTRTCILLIGVFLVYWGLFYEGKEDVWDYMAITGAVYTTGAFALLLGGIYCRWVNSAGALLALLGGFFAVFGLEPLRAAVGLPAWMDGTRVGLVTVVLCLGLLFGGSLLFPIKRNGSAERGET